MTDDFLQMMWTSVDIRQELSLLKNKTSVTLQWIPSHCGVGGRPDVKNRKQVGAICTPHVLQRSKDHPKKQLQDRVATTPRYWDRRRQHPPAGQRAAQVTIFAQRTDTVNSSLLTPSPPPPAPSPTPPPALTPQTENFPFRRMPERHKSSNPQPHPAVLPHLRRFETPDMAQSVGCPQEALRTGRDTVADCGLRLTHWTEDLAWPGTQKKKKALEKVLGSTIASI